MKTRILFATLAVYLFSFTGAASAAPLRPPAPPKAEGVKLVAGNGVLGLPVVINGVKGALMVDTGAMMTTLRKSDAKALKVHLKLSDVMSSGIGGKERAMIGKVSVAVPGCRKEDFPTLSGDVYFAEIHRLRPFPGHNTTFGVIGLPELSAAGAVIDVRGLRMLLHPRDIYKAPKGFNGMSLSRRTSPGSVNFMWAVPVQVGKTRGMMIVDTGAQYTVISNSFARLAGIPLQKSTINLGGAGQGTQQSLMGIIPRIQVGANLNLGRISVLVPDLAALEGKCNGLPVVGVLGFDQLDRMKAIMDCKRGVLYATSEPLKADTGLCTDSNQIIQAMIALAENGDAEAKEILDTARRNGGRINLTPRRAGEFVARARQKGLIK